jgi:integrase
VASISNDPNGRRRIQFFGSCGARKCIRLGKVPKKEAEEIKRHIELLVHAQFGRTAPPIDTSQWVADLNFALALKLSRVGLIDSPASSDVPTHRMVRPKLAKFLDSYIEGRRGLKPSTVAHLKRCRDQLVRILGAETLLTAITVGDAKRFREGLSETMAPNTVRRICGRAKQFFQAAIDDEYLVSSPFGKMKDTNVKANKSRDFEITQEVAAKVLAACPDAEWQLVFALARFGGLRCPSEIFALRWADVDWTASKVTINSPKTGVRRMPLFGELRPYLEAAFEPESEFVIVANRSKSNLRTQLTRIIKKAGLKPWPKLFQNLRASRSTELARDFGAFAEAEWLGHSPEVAGEFYVRATEADFARAAAKANGISTARHVEPNTKAAQKAAQQTAETSSNEPHRTSLAAKNPGELDIPRGSVRSLAPPRGLEPRTKRLTAACSTN